MKHYVAKELPAEDFDARNYLDEGLMTEDGIAIYGNKEFIGYNESLIEDTYKAILDCAEDIDCLNDGIDPDLDEDSKKAIETNTVLAIKHFFGEEVDIEALKQVIKDFNDDHFDYRDLLCRALTAKLGVRYDYKYIRGCCQGDFNVIYFPAGTSDDYIDYIEAVYFGLGTELLISCEAIEDDEDIMRVDNYCDYTKEYRPEKIKTWLANSIGCKEDEIKLLHISGSYTAYKYEEA